MDRFNGTVVTYSYCLPTIPDVSYSPDPDDNKIIATAIAGHTNYIVTGDKRDLLALDTVENINIITARQAAVCLEL